MRRFVLSVLMSLSLLSAAPASAALENSVLPNISRFENADNIPFDRYPEDYASDIKDALKHLDEKVRLVSYNILTPHYDSKLEESDRWPTRLPRLLEMLKAMDADVLGVQELYDPQIAEVTPLLEDVYAFYAATTEDGTPSGNGIFWKKDRFELVETFDAAAYLTQMLWFLPLPIDTDGLTVIKLKDLKTEHSFFVCNHHFAFSDIDRRCHQAISVSILAALLIESGENVVFMGDLNTFPERLDLEDLPAHDGELILRILTESGEFEDARAVAVLGHLGPLSTFTNKPGSIEAFQGTGTPGVMLDHIFVSQLIVPIVHAVDPAMVDGRYPSDHMPVIIDAIIRDADWDEEDDCDDHCDCDDEEDACHCGDAHGHCDMLTCDEDHEHDDDCDYMSRGIRLAHCDEDHDHDDDCNGKRAKVVVLACDHDDDDCDCDDC